MIGVNTLITDLPTAEQYLILWISEDGNYGYWHNLTSSSRTPLKFESAAVIAGIEEEKYESDSFVTAPRPEESLSVNTP